MKQAFAFVVLIVAIFVSFTLQEWLPGIHSFLGARWLFVPTLFCFGALTFSFPAMVALAVYTGLLTDLAYMNVAAGQVEIALGWSIVYFVTVGILIRGFQPAYTRGHWWILIPVSVVVTAAFLALQFAMISLRREGLVFNEVVFWRIAGAGLLAGIFAPFVSLVVWQAGQWTGGPARQRVVLQ